MFEFGASSSDKNAISKPVIVSSDALPKVVLMAARKLASGIYASDRLDKRDRNDLSLIVMS